MMCVKGSTRFHNFINHLVDQLRIRYEMMEILFQSVRNGNGNEGGTPETR